MRNLIAVSLFIFALAGCNSEADKKQAEIEALTHKAATKSHYKPTEKPLDWTTLHKGTNGDKNENQR